MKKAAICFLLLVCWFSGFGRITSQAWAQNETETSKPDSSKSVESQTKVDNGKAVAAYRLEFDLTELDGGKKINSRSYSLLVQPGIRNKLRAGSRIPVVTAQIPNSNTAMVSNQFQYVDIGMSIDCMLEERRGQLLLEATLESSNFSQPPGAGTTVNNAPVIGQLMAQVNTIVDLGKPVLVANMDDPSSKHQFQVEVTTTKIK